MKFVKKFFLVFVMLFALTALVACGGNDLPDDVNDVLQESIVVNFDTQGGSAVEKMTLKVSDAANFKLPADPTKEGYAFVGWYLDASYTNEFKDLEAKKGEITLYAKWETVSSTSIVIKFETNGGTPINNVVLNVLNPDLTKLAQTPVKAGEVFLGWFLDANLTKAVSASELAKALESKEITLYAKWGKEGEVTLGGIHVSAAIEANITGHVTTVDTSTTWAEGQDEPTTTEKVEDHTLRGLAKVNVDLQVSANDLQKFEDLGVALVVNAEVDAKADDDAFNLPKTEIKVYLSNGVLYALLPAMLTGTEQDMGVSINLVEIYEQNIDTVKDALKQAIAMLKSLPADELPEGFDLSVLDRIDVDNLKLEDLVALLDLLPEEYKEVIQNPEELTAGSLLELFGNYLAMSGVELSEEDLATIERIVNEFLEVLKGLLPTKTENGNTVKYELTDKQVKDTVDKLAACIKKNVNDIYTIVSKFYGGGSAHEDEEIDLEYYEFNEDGEKVYVFQPKYEDANGVVHYYKDEQADEFGFYDHGIYDADFFFPYFYPRYAYYSYNVAFDTKNDWALVILEGQAFYEAGDDSFNLYLFAGKDEFYDTQTKSYISIERGYELLKNQEFSPFYLIEDYNIYMFGNAYFDASFKRLTREEAQELMSSSYDLSEMINPMVDAYAKVIKDSLTIKDCYLQVTTNGVFPTNVKGLVDVTVEFDGSKYAELGMDPRTKVEFSAKASLDVNAELLTSGILFPDFTTYMDMTEMVNALVEGALEDVLGGGGTPLEVYPQ